jgi:hypothetical protein
MGLDFDQLFPNRFLKAGEFKGKDVTLTIAGVEIEELEGDKGKQTRGIIAFRETKKALVLNKTNGLCLRGMFGRDTGGWVGKRVTFFPAPIDFGDAEIAIRVRGSPDIPKTMEIEIKLARKKARKVTMQKTGPAQAPTKANGRAPQPGHAVASPETAPEPPADMDSLTGEVPFDA